jgi:hypothetical protein
MYEPTTSQLAIVRRVLRKLQKQGRVVVRQARVLETSFVLPAKAAAERSAGRASSAGARA